MEGRDRISETPKVGANRLPPFWRAETTPRAITVVT